MKSNPFSLFEGSIRSPQTRDVYVYSLHEFMKFAKIKKYDDIIKFKTDKIQQLLQNWVLHLREKDIKGKSIKAKLCAVELFLDMNMVIFHKKILHKLIPSSDYVPGGDVPFTNEEIQKMLSVTTKPRTKALIHFLSSTGGRPASITDPILRLKHVGDMPMGCKSIKIYDGSKEGYWGFLTPEASKSLHDYLDGRRLSKETLTDDSPVFANFENARGKKNDHLSAKSARQLLSNVMKLAGIERTKHGHRYDKATVYGFRKRFNTILKIDNTVNSNIAEKLMGHKKGLDGSYLKPTKEECFNEFLKAIPELTISDEYRDKFKIKKFEEERSEIERLKHDMYNMKKELEEEIDARNALDDYFRGKWDALNKIDPKKLEERGYAGLLLNEGKVPTQFKIPLEDILELATFYPHLAEAIGESGENLVVEGNVIKIRNKNK